MRRDLYVIDTFLCTNIARWSEDLLDLLKKVHNTEHKFSCFNRLWEFGRGDVKLSFNYRKV
jgi:hypothetical protein